MRRDRSIPPDYFEGLYRDTPDPWKFETSPYEAAKYAETLAALPPGTFASALEVGCSIGVLTHQLAPRCSRLLAVDVSDTALAAAAARCSDQPNIVFANMRLPQDRPAGPFDLVLLSEVAYYWDRGDLARTADFLQAETAPDGHVLLVHWTGFTDYPKSGDDAVAELKQLLGNAFHVEAERKHPEYRLDLWRRAP